MNNEVNSVCASCAITEGDAIKLKTCTACKLVRYCSVACQKEHRAQHKGQCRKRAAELREELLFKQPESSHLGDCPLCSLPLPLDQTKFSLHPCCSKIVCNGCTHANILREREESLEHKCPFCRAPCPKTKAEADEVVNLYLMKRVEVDDPVAISQMGARNYQKQCYNSAFELYTKAAELGDVVSHFRLAILYEKGQGAERDKKREMHHMEEASIGGHPEARFDLGLRERNMGRVQRAAKHFIIGANLGHDESMEVLKEYYKKGYVKKEDLEAALRAHKAAVDATKSQQREAAEYAMLQLAEVNN